MAPSTRPTHPGRPPGAPRPTHPGRPAGDPRAGGTAVPAQPDFPELERGVLDHWAAGDTFGESVRQRPPDREFVFYDGPPFANGLPHYGHLLTGFVKDVVPRYRTMRGQLVERRFGWDCHGLPAEMEEMFLAIEEEFRRGTPIGAWRRVFHRGESALAPALVEVGERWPTVLVGSYPTFSDDGPRVEVVLKSSDADALDAAAAWFESAVEQRG